jgi:hypothetical protein
VNQFEVNAAQIDAPDRQSDFHTNVWKEDQRGIFEQYLLGSNCTTLDCQRKEFDRSIDDATISRTCDFNYGATVLFWFTGELRSSENFMLSHLL